MRIIPTPNLIPESDTDYQRQNEIIRLLCLGVDNSIINWNTNNGFFIEASAGIIDISTDETIKLITLDSNIIISGGVFTATTPRYVGINYNDLTSVISTVILQGNQISYNYDRCGYWYVDVNNNEYRVLNKRLWRLSGQAGVIEQLPRGILL